VGQISLGAKQNLPGIKVIDNLRAAVTRADWYDPELNAKVAEFCQHYGTVMLPTRPAQPQHKGKVEAGVKFAQNNALKGRTFETLAAQNLFLAEWESGVADTRIHGTTRQQVGKVFQQLERPRLAALPASLFPVFEEAPRTVHRDGYIELHRAYYSAPPEYVGRSVWVRWESRLVRVFNQRREVRLADLLVVWNADTPSSWTRPLQLGLFFNEFPSRAAEQLFYKTGGVNAAAEIGVLQNGLLKQYGGADLNTVKELKALKEENAKLKKLVADLALDKV
jgi:hypothetical protein